MRDQVGDAHLSPVKVSVEQRDLPSRHPVVVLWRQIVVLGPDDLDLPTYHVVREMLARGVRAVANDDQRAQVLIRALQAGKSGPAKQTRMGQRSCLL